MYGLAISTRAEYTCTEDPATPPQSYTQQKWTQMPSHQTQTRMLTAALPKLKTSKCPSMLPEPGKAPYSSELRASELPWGIPQSTVNRSQFINSLASHPLDNSEASVPNFSDIRLLASP